MKVRGACDKPFWIYKRLNNGNRIMVNSPFNKICRQTDIHSQGGREPDGQTDKERQANKIAVPGTTSSTTFVPFDFIDSPAANEGIHFTITFQCCGNVLKKLVIRTVHSMRCMICRLPQITRQNVQIVGETVQSSRTSGDRCSGNTRK